MNLKIIDDQLVDDVFSTIETVWVQSFSQVSPIKPFWQSKILNKLKMDKMIQGLTAQE